MKNVAVKQLGVALVSLAALGATSQASADVYGAGRLIVSGLSTEIDGLVSGAPGLWNFTTSANANLNGASSGGSIRNCSGFGVDVTGGSCDSGAGAGIVLSGPVQNAPGGAPLRGENDSTLFGTGAGQYSNAESVIIDAQLVGDAATAAGVVAESNIDTGNIASASSNVASTTALSFEFEIDDQDNGAGGIAISFTADWAALSDVNGSSDGLAQGVISSSVTITSDNGTFIRWAPDGDDGAAGVEVCIGGAAIDCSSVEAGNLNVLATTATNGSPDGESGSGFFSLTVTGLESGTYSLGFAASAQSLVSQQVPAPATLLLMGAGLLAGAGFSRRKKA
ncbi:MAG: hypothetical protein CME59_03270 [Halioglobus sp.]|nr:hypothetical protein [Halioglobus sp.]|tara:strand:+ start:619 stop:1629 length:1011 start_codon:yes stop_codon:yes gene_type:complete